MSPFTDPRVAWTLFLYFLGIGATVGGSSYISSGLMGNFSSAILPYFYMTQAIFIYLPNFFKSSRFANGPLSKPNGFILTSIISLAICFILANEDGIWMVFISCLVLTIISKQVFIFIDTAISLAFTIREFRQLAGLIVVISGLAGIFFSVTYSLLIYFFGLNILIPSIVLLYSFCPYLIGKLIPIHRSMTKIKQETKVENPSFFYPLAAHSIIVAAITILISYLYLISLKQNFDKNTIAIVDAIVIGLTSFFVIFIQFYGQPWYIKRFGLRGAFLLYPITMIVFGALALIYPNYMIIILISVTSTIIYRGTNYIAYETLLNTATEKIRQYARAQIRNTSQTIGRALIPISILLLLGDRYATISNVVLITIFASFIVIYVVQYIYKGYRTNLKGLVEQTRYLNYEPIYTENETLINTFLDISSRHHTYEIIQYFKKNHIEPATYLAKEIHETKSIIKLQTYVKVLGKLPSNESEKKLFELLRTKTPASEILSNSLCMAIAIRALTIGITSSFRSYIENELRLQKDSVISTFLMKFHANTKHIQLEIDSRYTFAIQRFLYLFATISDTRAVLNTIPKIQGQIFHQLDLVESSEAIEYLEAITNDHLLRSLLQETLEPIVQPISPEKYAELIAQDTWLSQVNLIKEFIPGENMNTNEKVLFLRRVNIFKTMPAEALEVMTESLIESKVAANEDIFLYGDDADRVYMVVSGVIQIHIDKQVLNEVSEFGLFGELALLDNLPRTATATAKTNVVLFAIYKQEFNQLLEDMPELSKAVIAQLLPYLRRLPIYAQTS